MTFVVVCWNAKASPTPIITIKTPDARESNRLTSHPWTIRKMPKATTARTTRTERMPYRKSRSRRLDTGRSGLLLVIPSRSSLGRREDAPEWPDELGEFARQGEYLRGART